LACTVKIEYRATVEAAGRCAARILLAMPAVEMMNMRLNCLNVAALALTAWMAAAGPA
jgi:hypothetical protein